MSENEELVTIPDAAAQLNLHEKRLRRLLKRPEYADKTQTLERETRTGTRTVTVLPSPLLADLRARLSMEEASDNGDGDRYRDTERTGTGTRTGTRQASTSTLQLAAVYERVLQEKDARIADQAARIAFLEKALTQEQENAARTQALLALAAPPKQAEKPAESTETGDSTPDGQNAQTEAGGGTEGQQRARRAWWQVWRREGRGE